MNKDYENMFPEKVVAANIQRLSQAKGMVKSEIARNLGIALSTFWAIETGMTKVRINMIIKIAAVLEVDIREILMPEDYALDKDTEVEKLKQAIAAAEHEIAKLKSSIEKFH